MNKPHDLIIIGSGPAGLTAGIYAARANLHPYIIEGSKPGGQLMGTSWVENWPGEKRILGPDLIKKLHEQAEALGCSFVSQTVIAVDLVGPIVAPTGLRSSLRPAERSSARS